MTEYQIKAVVRERDGLRCTRCGMGNEAHRKKYHGKSLHVHRKEPGEPYSVGGCVTLCVRCHAAEAKSVPWEWLRLLANRHLSPELARSVNEYIDGISE